MKSPQLNWTLRCIPAASPGAKFTAMWILLLACMQVTVTSFSPRAKQNMAASGVYAETVNAPAGDWVLHSTVRNVDFYYRISDCSGKNAVFLKFNNRNRAQVKISWKEVFTTQFDVGKEGFRGIKHLLLPIGETAVVDCANITIKECVVLPSHVTPSYMAEIRQFTFRNITVVNQ